MKAPASFERFDSGVMNESLQSGDKVLLSLCILCGDCKQCKSGHPANCHNQPYSLVHEVDFRNWDVEDAKSRGAWIEVGLVIFVAQYIRPSLVRDPSLLRSSRNNCEGSSPRCRSQKS